MAIQTYLVGGYVRDLLLSRHGIPATPSDKDYVVVGATPEYMVSKGSFQSAPISRFSFTRKRMRSTR